MQNGKWVPVSKYFADSLPRDRKFTELEAIYSLQLDYDNDNSITVSGCASRWGWSRSKVSKFLFNNNIVVVYDSDTKNLKKQRGFIDIHQDKKRALNEHKEDIKEALKEHKRFIDSKWIQEKKDIKKTKKKHKKDINSSTTTDPNPEPNSKKITDKILKPENVTEQTWNDFKKHRDKKKAIITQNVINGFESQAGIVGWTLENAMKESIERGWSGFKAEWVKNKTAEPAIRNTFKD